MARISTTVASGFLTSSYNTAGITLTKAGVYIQETLYYVGYVQKGGKAAKATLFIADETIHMSRDMELLVVATKYEIGAFLSMLTSLSDALMMYYMIEYAVEQQNAVRKFQHDMNQFKYVCEVGLTTFQLQANTHDTDKSFNVEFIYFRVGNTNATPVDSQPDRMKTSVHFEPITFFMIVGTDVPTVVTTDYTTFPIGPLWNQFDMYVVAELVICWSDVYHGDLETIPRSKIIASSNFTIRKSPSITAQIINVFYDDATTITMDIVAGGGEFDMHNFSYYVGSYTDEYLAINGYELYTGSRDIDMVGLESFFNPDGNQLNQYVTLPYYFYNVIDELNHRYKVRMSKAFTFVQVVTTAVDEPTRKQAKVSVGSWDIPLQSAIATHPTVDHTTEYVNNLIVGNNVTSKSLRGDMRQFDARLKAVVSPIPDNLPPITKIILNNLLSVQDTLEYLGNNTYRFTMSNVTAPFNFKYGFNKLLDQSVDNPSIMLAPMTVETPTATYIINAVGTNWPSMKITLSKSFPSGVTGANIGYEWRVLNGDVDVTSTLTPVINGGVYLFENMDSNARYTFQFIAWANHSDGTGSRATPLVVGPYVLKNLLIPSLTNTTFTASNGKISLNSVVPTYYGIDFYLLTVGNSSPKPILFTGQIIEILESLAVPPLLCTLQTSLNNVVSQPLSIIYNVGVTDLLTIPYWWLTGALYVVASATCAQLTSVDRSRVLRIQVEDTAVNITHAFDKQRLGTLYARNGSTITSTDSELSLRCAMVISAPFMKLLSQNSYIVLDSAEHIIAQLAHLNSSSFRTITSVTNMVIDGPKYLANPIPVSKFSEPFQIAVDADTIKQIVPSVLSSLMLSDTAPRIKSLDLSLYDKLISIAVVANNAYDANLTYSWNSFKMEVVNAYVTPFSVTDVPLVAAAIIKTNKNATVTIHDTADNYNTDLGRLSFSGIRSISLTGSLTMTYNAFAVRATCILITNKFSVTNTTLLTYIYTNPFLSTIRNAAVTIQDTVVNVTWFLKSVTDYKNIAYIYADGIITMPYTQFLTTNEIVQTGYNVTNAPVLYASALNDDPLVSTYTVQDTSSEINSGVATLMQSSKLTAISSASPILLNYTSDMNITFYKKFLKCATVNNVDMNSLATVLTWFILKSPTTIGVVDTSTAIAANFSALLNAQSRVSSVRVSDTGRVRITASAFIDNQTFLASAFLFLPSFEIVDSANTTQSLSAFSDNVTLIVSIQLGLISIPYLTYLNKTLLTKLQTPYNVIGAPCSALSTLFSLQACQGVGVTDSAVNILKYLSLLQTNVLKINSVTSSTTSISPTIAQYLNPNPSSSINTIYQKMTNFLSPASIPCSHLSSYVSRGQLVVVSDSAAAILKNLVALNSGASYILSISASTAITLTYSQTLAYPLALAKISTSYTVSGSGDNIKAFVLTNTAISGISVTSGSLDTRAFTAFAPVLSGTVPIVDTNEAIIGALPTMNTYAAAISSITSSSSTLSQFDTSVTTLYANLVPLFANFAMLDSYANLFSALLILMKSKVSRVGVSDSITIQQFVNVSGLPLQSIQIMDTASAVQTWLQAVPPTSVASIQTIGDALLFFGSTYNNAALLQSKFQVANVPCASITTTLANPKVSGIYVLDTTAQIAAYQSALFDNSLKIINTVGSDGGSIKMNVSNFLTYATGTPTYAISIVDSSTEILNAMDSLMANNLFIQRVNAKTESINLSVASIQTYASVVLKMSAFTVTDNSTTITTNLSLLNLYPITSIFISGSGTITLAVYQLCQVVTKLQAFILSDTAMNLQSLVGAGFSPYQACTAINVTSGTVTLSFAQIDSFVSKMSANSVVLSDTASNVVSFSALSPYTSQISSVVILGTVTLDYGVYNSTASAKFTNFIVLNVPTNSINAILARAYSISVTDSSAALAAAMQTIGLNASKITTVTMTDNNAITLAVIDFVNYSSVIIKFAGLTNVVLTGTPTQITSSLSTMSANTAMIQSVVVSGFSVTYSNFATYSSILSKFAATFVVTDVPLAQVISVIALSNVSSVEVKDTLTNLSTVINNNSISDLAALEPLKISVMHITEDIFLDVSYNVYNQFKAFFKKISLS